MIEPSLGSLLKKVDTRFTLCIVTGKRARQLTDGAQVLTDCDSRNSLTIAATEIDENRITYRKKKSKVQNSNVCYTSEYFDQP